MKAEKVTRVTRIVVAALEEPPHLTWGCRRGRRVLGTGSFEREAHDVLKNFQTGPMKTLKPNRAVVTKYTFLAYIIERMQTSTHIFRVTDRYSPPLSPMG